MIIEKATNSNISDYARNNFTVPMGFESQALWQLDSRRKWNGKSILLF